jgi:PAS domain S-box-containing protein
VRREDTLLKESASRLRTILESVPIGVVVLDTNNRIEFVNSAVQSA